MFLEGVRDGLGLPALSGHPCLYDVLGHVCGVDEANVPFRAQRLELAAMDDEVAILEFGYLDSPTIPGFHVPEDLTTAALEMLVCGGVDDPGPVPRSQLVGLLRL